MREDELREAGALVGEALGEVSRGAHRIHGAISHRVRAALGRVAGVAGFAGVAGVTLGPGLTGEPGRPATGPITSLTYAAVDLSLVTAGRVGGLVLARTRADDRAAADSAGRLLAMVNGSHGHILHARQSPLALTASVRAGGADVRLTPAAVRATWAQAGGELAVYVHGLVDSELRWGRVGGGGLAAPTLPDRLAGDLGLTPVLVRYNTGRRIEDSARAISELLGALVRAWPVPVTRIVLIGHSMGGLVGRGAVALAAEADSAVTDSAEVDWAGLVTDVITIGTPRGGGWLEHAVDRLSPHLARLPETEWIGEQIEHRSDGIRDLGTPHAATLPTGVRERAVVGAVVGELSGPIGRAVGDLMVSVDSASDGLSPDSVAVITGATHAGLIHDLRVAEQLVRWLTPAPD